MLGTSKIEVQSTGNGLAVKATCRDFEIIFDEPLEAGGTNTGMNPIEGLLCTLGACQSIAAMIFAQSQGVQIEHVSMTVEGDLDSDGFMGLDPRVRNGLQEVRCQLHLEGPDKKALSKIAALAQEKCPVGDSIKNTVPLVDLDYIVD